MDVIHAAQVVNEWGAGVSIDNLGENVTNADEAKHSAELYHHMLDEIHQRKLNANISLKLTHMGLDVSEELAFGLVTELVDHAVRINNFVRVDMEGSPYTQRTLDFVRGLIVSRDTPAASAPSFSPTCIAARRCGRPAVGAHPHPAVQGRL